jgi:DeoR family fructose operon transcriptional repressor
VLSQQRRDRIINLLSEHTFYGLAQLAGELEVSISTARRDLDALESEGIVKRTHGGVMYVGDKNALPIFAERQGTMAVEKASIGRRGAELIEDGDTIIIDGGTTPYQVALHIRQKNVQVITNSLPVANLFADSTSVQVVSTGGTLYPGTGVYLGPFAENMLRGVRAQKAFIGVAGIAAEGLYNSNALVVETERRIIDAASEIYVVTDSSKFGRRALSFLCDFAPITAIITEDSGQARGRVEEAMDGRVRMLYAQVNAKKLK